MRNLIVFVAALCLLAAAPQDRGKRPKQSKGPDEGDKAPDFKLKKLLKDESEKKGKAEYVELLKTIKKNKKPVVLIFGSYT